MSEKKKTKVRSGAEKYTAAPNPLPERRRMIDLFDVDQVTDRYVELMLRHEETDPCSMVMRMLHCGCNQKISIASMQTLQSLAHEMVESHLVDNEEVCAEAVFRGLLVASLTMAFVTMGAPHGPSIAQILEDVFVVVAGAAIHEHHLEHTDNVPSPTIRGE